MKKITTTLIILGTLTLGLAENAKVDAQIERIQNAPAAEKVKLVNEFKKQLMTMNKEQRQEAVAAMQAEMQAAGEMTQAQVQERKQVREAQAEATGEMNRHQHQHQKQMGSQAGRQIMDGTTGQGMNNIIGGANTVNAQAVPAVQPIAQPAP